MVEGAEGVLPVVWSEQQFKVRAPQRDPTQEVGRQIICDSDRYYLRGESRNALDSTWLNWLFSLIEMLIAITNGIRSPIWAEKGSKWSSHTSCTHGVKVDSIVTCGDTVCFAGAVELHQHLQPLWNVCSGLECGFNFSSQGKRGERSSVILRWRLQHGWCRHAKTGACQEKTGE